MVRLRYTADEWVLGAAAAAAVSFGLAFLALALGLIELQPAGHSDFPLFGSCFGLSGFSLLGLALRLYSLGISRSVEAEQIRSSDGDLNLSRI